MIPREIFAAEHELFRDGLRRMAASEFLPRLEEWERAGSIPPEVWRRMGDAGFLCTSMPEEFGGAGADRLYAAVVLEELTRIGLLAPALAFSLHSEIVAPYLLHYGSEEQKARFLPEMAAGRRVAAIAMSEPDGGSDLQSLRTTARREGDEYVLNGRKTFITNGQNAGLVVVAAKTAPDQGAKGVSLILVEAERDGFRRGRTLDKLGLRASDTAELFFDDVRVPAANLLGREGGGFAYLMQELPWERLQIAVSAVAASEAALETTRAYVKERRAFGQPLAAFQNTRFVLAELTTETQIARVFVDRCLALTARGELDVETAAMAKYWTTDLQNKVVDGCLQLHGGYGYMREYPIAKAFVDARAQRIYGGTNEIMKELIARSL